MAGASLLALLDDIATILDDVALMTKVAAKKTAGVLGDDLALNTQQVAGVQAERELPVVWAVAKGSFRNKLILVPAALVISALIPWAVLPLLMLGGAYLCYEGFEKVVHKLIHGQAEEQAHHSEMVNAIADPTVNLVDFEKQKIEGAIRTDFILSAEIITITLGMVAKAPFGVQILVLAGIAIIMTVGVYGLVAGIVKLDDIGLYLSRKSHKLQQNIGKAILLMAPYMMKLLSILGTVAMFLVGGGILTHGIPSAHELIHTLAQGAHFIPVVGGIFESLIPMIFDALVGMAVGAIVLAGVTVIKQKVEPVHQDSEEDNKF